MYISIYILFNIYYQYINIINSILYVILIHMKIKLLLYILSLIISSKMRFILLIMFPNDINILINELMYTY